MSAAEIGAKPPKNVTANLLQGVCHFICQFCRQPASSCWFCLSSSDVESDSIISLGGNYYCALAKGPLVQKQVILVPIEHSANTLIMTSEAEKVL
jgi:Protein similar to CwfJ C-terminus 1